MRFHITSQIKKASSVVAQAVVVVALAAQVQAPVDMLVTVLEAPRLNSPLVSNALLTEDGSFFLCEDGSYLLFE